MARRLLGVDVGYSTKHSTTGIAVARGEGIVCAWKARTDRDDRFGRLGAGFCADVVAVDGPLLPAGTPPGHIRSCERAFMLGAFQGRCKPGSSHHPVAGMRLRTAATATLAQLEGLVADGPGLPQDCRVVPGAFVVEAFPNAFLGVMVPDADFAGCEPARKRRKFDWLYDRAVANRAFERLAGMLEGAPLSLAAKLDGERDHERRAALVCLLVAALAGEGRAVAVGDPVGGWFWQPPFKVWAPWARDALMENIGRLHKEGVAVEVIQGWAGDPLRPQEDCGRLPIGSGQLPLPQQHENHGTWLRYLIDPMFHV